MFFIFLASFAVLEVILWRTEQARNSRETSSANSLASILALAQALHAEGRGAAAGAKEKSAVDTLK